MSREYRKVVPPAPVRVKRRWVRYLLIGLGSLLLMGIIAVAVIAAYSNSLMKRYTQSQPQKFEAIEDPKAAMERLKAKFAEFQQELNTSPAAVKPLELSADELNAALASTRGVGNRMRLAIEGGQLKSKFSFPMGNPGSRRYLNGEATLKVKLENGFLDVSISSAQANHQPLPGWALSMLRNRNVDLWNKQFQALEFFQKLDSISVQDGAVVLTPHN